MNFNILLVILWLTLVSGLIWLVDSLLWARKRALIATEDKRQIKQPLVVDYAKSLFPIFIIVLVIRAFVFQPYRVPTGSLEPTIMPGDFVFVTQYNYGLHFPVWHWQLLPTTKPKVGQIAVLRWPVNPNENFIKRIVGVPGDTISYVNKVLYINGKEQKQTFVRNTTEKEGSGPTYHAKVMQEDLNGVKHDIYVIPKMAAKNFHNLVVPKGEFFAMGDNRDGSDDSRDWGFVPEKNLVGKGDFIFFSWNTKAHRVRWSRIGTAI